MAGAWQDATVNTSTGVVTLGSGPDRVRLMSPKFEVSTNTGQVGYGLQIIMGEGAGEEAWLEGTPDVEITMDEGTAKQTWRGLMIQIQNVQFSQGNAVLPEPGGVLYDLLTYDATGLEYDRFVDNVLAYGRAGGGGLEYIRTGHSLHSQAGITDDGKHLTEMFKTSDTSTATNWANNTAYAVGDIAKDTILDASFLCHSAHTSSASGTFSDYRAASAPNAARWKQMRCEASIGQKELLDDACVAAGITGTNYENWGDPPFWKASKRMVLGGLLSAPAKTSDDPAVDTAYWNYVFDRCTAEVQDIVDFYSGTSLVMSMYNKQNEAENAASGQAYPHTTYDTREQLYVDLTRVLIPMVKAATIANTTSADILFHIDSWRGRSGGVGSIVRTGTDVDCIVLDMTPGLETATPAGYTIEEAIFAWTPHNISAYGEDANDVSSVEINAGDEIQHAFTTEMETFDAQRNVHLANFGSTDGRAYTFANQALVTINTMTRWDAQTICNPIHIGKPTYDAAGVLGYALVMWQSVATAHNPNGAINDFEVSYPEFAGMLPGEWRYNPETWNFWRAFAKHLKRGAVRYTGSVAGGALTANQGWVAWKHDSSWTYFFLNRASTEFVPEITVGASRAFVKYEYIWNMDTDTEPTAVSKTTDTINFICPPRSLIVVTQDTDVTAPTITSSNTASVAENATLSKSLTASESVTWTITGGADQARFEISGSTLRWASNGTKDFETPDDANTDNAYVVQVTATDAATNATNQTITVTVTDVTVPSTIADLTAAALSDTEVQLTFTNATGATSHEYRLDGGSAVALAGNKIVTGLTAVTEYDFEVRGVSAEGNGAWSNLVTETTEAASNEEQETTDFFDFTTANGGGEPDGTQRTRDDTLFAALKNGATSLSNILAKLEGLYVYRNAVDEPTAKVNLATQGVAFNLTESGTMTWGVSTGFTGDGSSHLDTGFNPTVAVGFGQDDHCMFAAVSAVPTPAAVGMVGYTECFVGLDTTTTGGLLRARLRSGSTTNETTAIGIGAVHRMALSRSVSTEFKWYKDGAAQTSITRTSTSMPSFTFFGAGGYNTTSPVHNDWSVTHMGFGAALTDAEHADLDAAIAAFLT